jgi:hypothetical protein
VLSTLADSPSKLGDTKANGTWRTSISPLNMSALRGKADIPDPRSQCPLMTQSRHAAVRFSGLLKGERQLGDTEWGEEPHSAHAIAGRSMPFSFLRRA